MRRLSRRFDRSDAAAQDGFVLTPEIAQHPCRHCPEYGPGRLESPIQKHRRETAVRRRALLAGGLLMYPVRLHTACFVRWIRKRARKVDANAVAQPRVGSIAHPAERMHY